MSVCPLDLAISMGLEFCKTKLVYTRTLHHSNEYVVSSHATAIHALEDSSNLES